MRTKMKPKEGPLTVADLGRPPLSESKRATWVQTERAAHQAWAELVRTNGRAAALLHILVANMDRSGVVVASRATLAKLVGCSEATIKRAVADLVADCWVDVTQLGRGTVNAYAVNNRVAWADKRENLPMAVFSARVLTIREEQDSIETAPLRLIPTLYPGERQLPMPDEHSEGLPDLPALNGHQDDDEREPALPSLTNEWASSGIADDEDGPGRDRGGA